MLIYRVEDIEGLGPYRGNMTRLIKEMMNCHSFSEYHPVAPRPKPYPQCLHLFCGFKSLGQLKIWFGPFLRRLLKGGYRIAVYRVEQIAAEDSHQVVFDRSSAVWLREISIDNACLYGIFE